MTDVIAISADGSEYQLQPLKTLIVYNVKVIFDAYDRPARCIATIPGDRQLELDVSVVAWASTIRKVQELQDRLNEPNVDTGIVQLVKTIRRQHQTSLFDAKQIGDLLVKRHNEMVEGPAIVRIMNYEVEQQTTLGS